MPLPPIISAHLLPAGALAPLGTPPLAPPAVAAAGGGGPGANSLAFTMFFQEEDNWCWAAVGVSIAQFYNSSTPWTSQCQLATTELGPTCCPAGSNPTCDVPYFLDLTLTRVGHLNTWANSSLSLDEIAAEIDSAHPVGVRIGWNNGGGHFVVLSAYSRSGSTERVTVEDPIWGESTWDLDEFQIAYRDEGTWTHTYWTQP